MAFEVFSDAAIEHFIERGWVRLQGAFAREDALAVQDFIWERVAERGVRREDRATWTRPMVHIQETYTEPLFQKCHTPRLTAAIEDLVGVGRWRDRDVPGAWGWWPVNFPQGADAGWDVASRGWHWDGEHFRHFLHSPNQGLLLIPCFSDVRPRGGGTLIASGSHKIVAQFLKEYPDGLGPHEAIRLCTAGHPWLADLAGGEKRYSEDAPEGRIARFMEQSWTDEHGTELRVEEVTCDAGDVFLCHPFLYHAVSTNLTGEPRFMCNRTTPLLEPMHVERADGDYSPVEESLRRALGAVAA